ncbi:hypothetical protein K492DRAFT_175545 [Lichtheimia hyalospora FSU 10163]|nr:hypothetical protein K492DRAFT_175545 [Lichtheimia hyalospora FSU 10163]
MKQQQNKVQGMEIELVQAKNAVEQPSKGCHCINLYCLKGDATFPSALAPSALVPNAITLRGLIY